MRIPALTVLLIVFVGCAKPPPVTFDTQGLQPLADYSNLEFVLAKSINSKNQFMPEALDACKDRLESQLKLMSITGPTSSRQLFAAQDDRLAYWYNASEAWSLQLAMLAGYPKEMPDLHRRRFVLDGRVMTLNDIHTELAKEDDFRIPLLMPCICLGHGLLPQKPFTGADFNQRLAAAFNNYINDSRRLVIDIEDRKILFPPELWNIRDRLISDYEKRYQTQNVRLTTALLPYTAGSAHRRLQDAIGYREQQGGLNPLLALPGKFDFLIKK